jgi:putative transposase
MSYDPSKSHRHSIRLRGYDYTQAGAYFVTIVARNRECLFGEVVGGEMRVNACGEIVVACWDALPMHFPAVELDAFVVMPNHVHGIILIGGESTDYGRGGVSGTPVGAQHAAPLPDLSHHNVDPGSLGAIVRSFKSGATKRINEMRGAPGAPVWQRNYFEHIIRNEKSLNAIRGYIVGNPGNWAHDEENPNCA